MHLDFIYTIYWLEQRKKDSEERVAKSDNILYVQI